MGYYTGTGVDISGGSSTSLRSNGPAVGGAYYVYQRIDSVTNVRRGVSKETAQGEKGDINLDFFRFPGGMVEPACRGTQKSVRYEQIGGSNLYELSVTTDAIQVRGKQGSYDSGWVS